MRAHLMATAALAGMLLPATALPQPAPNQRPEIAAIDGSAARPVAVAAGVEACFAEWLASQDGLVEGPNPRPGRGMLFVSRGTGEIRVDRGSPQFLPARNAAFTRAELTAREALAGYIATEVRSDRRAEVFSNGGDEPAPPSRPAAERISNMQRLTTLTGLSLDNAIREFDPRWNGGGVTEEQRRQQVARMQVEASDRIATRAAVFAAGAMTAQQCEGLNDDGKYSVLVVMLWSQRLQTIADALVGRTPSLPPEAPQAALIDQFAARTRETPDWLSITEGARVWINERGERVVVGFGAVGASQMSSVDEQRARVRALAAIQRFVGERIEASATENAEFAVRETVGGETRNFDSSAFESRVRGRSDTVRLSGVSTVTNWRGQHPWGNVPMQVVVLGWTPSSAATGAALGQELREGERRRQGTGTSVAPSAGDRPPTPTRRGAGSNAADF